MKLKNIITIAFLISCLLLLLIFINKQIRDNAASVLKQYIPFIYEMFIDDEFPSYPALNIHIYTIDGESCNDCGDFVLPTTKLEHTSIAGVFKDAIGEGNTPVCVNVYKEDSVKVNHSDMKAWKNGYVYDGKSQKNTEKVLNELYTCMIDNKTDWDKEYEFESKCGGKKNVNHAYVYISNFEQSHSKFTNTGTMFRETTHDCKDCLNDAMILFLPSKDDAKPSHKHITTPSLNMRLLMHEIGHMFKLDHPENGEEYIMTQTNDFDVREGQGYKFTKCHSNYFKDGIGDQSRISFPGEKNLQNVTCNGNIPIFKKKEIEIIKIHEMKLLNEKSEYFIGEPIYLELKFDIDDDNYKNNFTDFIDNVDFKYSFNGGDKWINSKRLQQQPYLDNGSYLVPIFTDLDYKWTLDLELGEEQKVIFKIDEALFDREVKKETRQIYPVNNDFEPLEFTINKQDDNSVDPYITKNGRFREAYIQLLLFENPSYDHTQDSKSWLAISTELEQILKYNTDLSLVEATAYVVYVNYKFISDTTFCISTDKTNKKVKEANHLVGLLNSNGQIRDPLSDIQPIFVNQYNNNTITILAPE